MKKCPFCGAELKDDSLFCIECGKELPKGIECPHCGASVNEGDIFCTECGKRLDEVPQVTSSEPTKPKCPHCGALINEGDVFCMECGKKIDAAQTEKTDEVFVTKECPHCGATIREDAHFCPNCDKYIEEAPAESTTEIYEPIKKECPHCGALVDENDVRCEKCGKFLIEGVEDEYEEKTFKDYLPFIFATIIVFFLIGGAWWYWDSSNQRAEREKAIADSLEVVRQDSIENAAEKEKERLEAERISSMRETLSPEHILALMCNIKNTALAKKCGLEEVYRYNYESEEDEDGFVERLTIIIYGREVGKGSVSENGSDVNYQIISNSDHSCYLEYYDRQDSGLKMAFKDKEDANDFYNKIIEYGVYNYSGSYLIPKKKLFSGIRKVENFDYEEILFGMSELQQSEGWYVIYFNPYNAY